MAPAESDLARRLATAVHARDTMFHATEPEHYLEAGLSALRNVEAALTAARQETGQPVSVDSVLDLPCGYGRVLRWLRVRFPAADFLGCELEPQAARFCRDQLGIDVHASTPDFDALELGRRFDLIWCGSLFTHLDHSSARSLLACLHRHLNPGGVCVFTSHGQATEDLLRHGERSYDLEPTEVERLLRDFESTGFGFGEYSRWPGYGISLSTPAAVRRLAVEVGEAEEPGGAAWAEVFYRARGWDGHQDVFAYRRRR